MTSSLLRRGFGRVRRAVWPTTFERAYARWVADRGDETLRHAYPLGPAAVVLDVGGYEGGWAERALRRFGCTLHVFEPVPEYAAGIEARLADGRVAVHRYGLAGATRDAEFHMADDASSALRGGGNVRGVRLREAAEVFEELGLERVDLMKVNIEGGEYELLEHLLDRGLMPRVERLQVQFHDFVPDARGRMEAIQRRLAATHALDWQYVFVWESWRLRTLPAAGPATAPGAAAGEGR